MRSYKMGENDVAKAFWPKKNRRGIFVNYKPIGINFVFTLVVVQRHLFYETKATIQSQGGEKDLRCALVQGALGVNQLLY